MTWWQILAIVLVIWLVLSAIIVWLAVASGRRE